MTNSAITSNELAIVKPSTISILLSSVLALSACSSTDLQELNDLLPEDEDPITESTPESTPDPTPEPAPENIPLPTPGWTKSYPEGSLSPSRQTLIGNDSMALVRSSELDGVNWLTAIDPMSGDELWRLPNIMTLCAPAITANGNVVIHLDPTSAAGGNDSSADLALVDASTGTILDQWQPGAGVFFSCSNGQLMQSANNIIVHSLRGEHRGFRISEDNTVERVWENTELESFPSYDETQVLGDTLYVIQQLERSAGDGVKVVYVRRINANTGELLATLETTFRRASRLQIAGPDHLAINGVDENADEALMLLSGAGPDSGNNDLAVAWTRVFDGNGDGVTSTTSDLALSDNAFASWSKITAGSTVTEINLTDGTANWSFQTSSFSNNDTIVALPDGGYVVAPFGGNFLEATTKDGDLAWRIETVEEANFPQGFAPLGTDNLVVISESPSDDGWVAVGVNTNR